MFSGHTMSSCEFQMLFSLENRKVRNCSGRNRSTLMMRRSRVLSFTFTHVSPSRPQLLSYILSSAQTDQRQPRRHTATCPSVLEEPQLRHRCLSSSCARYLHTNPLTQLETNRSAFYFAAHKAGNSSLGPCQGTFACKLVQSVGDRVISFFVFSSSCFEKILKCPREALSQMEPLSSSK